MADQQGKGRGRGLALIQLALQKAKESESTEFTSSTITSDPSVVTDSTSTGPSTGGRGRLLMLMNKQKPGVIMGPASDVSSSQILGPGRGVGRGLKLLENMKLQSQSKFSHEPGPQGDSEVSVLTEQVAGTSLTSKPEPQGKNKYFREVKETPPVVKLGESGHPCQVTCNYIRLLFDENNVFEYEVKFDPDQDYRHNRYKLLYEHNDIIKENTFDGTTLYLPKKLPDEVTKLISTNPYDKTKVNVSIIFRRTRRLSEMIHIYNVLFKQIMKDLKLVRFGRQHFNEHATIQIPQHKLEVWPGYVTAIDEYEGGLMLTLDSAHRVLRTQTVLSFIHDIVQREGSNWKKVVTDTLIGCSVMTTYNKKLYRVDSIDDSMTPKSTFDKMENGQLVKMSYVDYYKNNYGIEIKDWNQPLLISRKTKRNPGSEVPVDFMFCLVPELCQMTGLTDEQRNNFHLMKDVATYTRITPNQRHAAFKEYIKNVMANDKAKQRLAGWGLRIAPETIDITARTMPPETLYFGKDVRIPGKEKAEWNAEVSRNSVMQAVDVIKWLVLYTKRDEKVANDFVETIMQCSRPMGIRVCKPDMVLLQSENTSAYVMALKNSFSKNLQLIVAICPTARDDRYAAIKKICCADNPVPSQVINSRTIKNTQKIRSITQKIALQINCKLGGTLWNINIPLKSTMIVGIDSFHDVSRKKRSVCAFVASYNNTFTHWYSRVIFQDQGQEIVDGLKCCLVQALKQYSKCNGAFPERIIIYRDGVGDGQLSVIVKYEIPQIKVSLSVVDKAYRPDLTYIVVQKRINTRIFMKLNGAFDNPSPGTVVDHDITRRDWYDFLIVSQKVNHGTVTPTHYIVLMDDNNITPDRLQRLTYKLCHLYYNWPGTVRVPAPCQYAHKLAFLVGQSIHQAPSDLLSDKLFFL